MKSRLNALAGFALMALGLVTMGCYAEAGTYVASESSVVYDDSPTLVAVEPGVWVMSRQPTAVYYVNDGYWTNRGGIWYRSSDWNGGWASVNANIVPVTIVHRDSTHYRYYNPPRHVATRPLPTRHYVAPTVRRGQERVHHNEVGSSWGRRDHPNHHKHSKPVKRGPVRGR